jgi:hypothetical protein
MDKYSDPIPSNPDNGVVRGDSKDMPNRGTSTGTVGMGAPYGASTDLNATNSMGSAHMDSDPADLCYPKGDADLRFNSGGHSTSDPGSHFTAEETPAADNKPNDQRGL